MFWDSIKIGANKYDFWNQPLEEKRCGEGVVDGGLYMMEGKINGKYNLIYRSNPINNGCPKKEEFHDLLRIFNLLATLGNEEFNAH